MFRPRAFNPDTEALRKLKLTVGDIILYQGVKYKVFAVGLKYLRAEALDNPKSRVMIHVSEAVKWIPDDQLNEVAA